MIGFLLLCQPVSTTQNNDTRVVNPAFGRFSLANP